MPERTQREMMPLPNDTDSLASALGRIASGCFILTVEVGGRSHAMLASWVQQASFEPPMLTVSVKQNRPAVPFLNEAGRFALNVIGPDPAPMFKHFARGFAADEDAFAGLEVESSEFGPLLHCAAAQLGCEVVRQHEAGDHLLYLAEVKAGRVLSKDRPYTHIRKNGLSY